MRTGRCDTEVVDDRILVMTVDRVEKKNAFTPKISNELAAAYTRLDDDPDLFVGVLTFAGDHTTAGLKMPLFFTEEASAPPAERRATQTQRRLPFRASPTPPVQAEVPRCKGSPTPRGSRSRWPATSSWPRGHADVAAGAEAGSAPLAAPRSASWSAAGGATRCTTCSRADEFGAEEAPAGSASCRRWSSRVGSDDRAVELARELLQCAPLALQHTIANARLALDADEPTAIDAIPGDEQGGHGDGRLPRGDRVVHRTTPGTVHGTLT